MKRTANRRIFRYKNTKTEYKTFEDGYELGSKFVDSWNSQPNPPKIYISGYRIHHGLVGIVLGLAGTVFEKPALAGLGVRLAVDDISDLSDWLNFERNDSIQYEQSYISPTYSGFV